MDEVTTTTIWWCDNDQCDRYAVCEVPYSLVMSIQDSYESFDEADPPLVTDSKGRPICPECGGLLASRNI